MGQKKKWSASAKFEIALVAIKSEMTLNEICKRYQVAPSQVHAWKSYSPLDRSQMTFFDNHPPFQLLPNSILHFLKSSILY